MDTITQDNPVKAVSDMRLAIKNTNVVLNMAISPGLILIPSNMIILKERVAGYNNVLTLATKDMKFGVNREVNYVKPTEDIKTTGTQGGGESPPRRNVTIPGDSTPHLTPKKKSEEPVRDISTTVFPKTNESIYLLNSAVTLGFIAASYII